MAIQGYDKTSTYSNLATGNVIEAAYFTNEYAEIFDAFKKTTSTTASGHRHDGGDAMGGYVALLSDSDNDTKITLETISISGGAPSYTDSDTITIIAGSATIATIDSGDINVAANKGITFGDDGEKIEGDGTDLTITGNNIKLTATADVVIPADVGITFGTGEKIEGNSTDLTVTSGADINLTATADVNIPSGVGVTFGDDGEKIEGNGTDLTVSASADLNLTATTDINIPADVGLTFGDDGEKIEGDGTDLTISSSALATIDAGTDIVLDADGGDIFFKDGGTTFGSATNTSGDLIIKSGTTTAMTFSGANVTFAGTITIGSAGISEAELEILDGATVTTTELNIIDGDTSASATTVADADRVVFNDAGTMKQVAVTDLAAYFDDEITAMPNLVTTAATTVGALASGSIASGFGNIDNGASNITSGGLVKLDVDADADDLTGDSATGRLTIGASEDLNLYHGGTNSYIVNDTGDLILDTADDITLDAAGGDVFFKAAGTTFGSATNTSGNLIIKSGTTTALTFSGANVTGSGTFEATTITASTSIVPDASGGADIGSTSAEWGDVYIADDKKIKFGSGQDVTIEYDEDDTDTLLIAGGSVTISDDLKLHFGTGKDFSIEYDEDGNDTTVAVGAGGFSFGPHGTSTGNTTSIQFQELAANGAHYVGFKAADSIAANVIWTLPNADGSANQVIKTDGSGALSWTTPSSGAVTAINNATANELVTIGSTTTELDAEGNLTFDGSTLAVTGDATISDDLGLVSDAALLTFGANSEVTVTHVHNTGLNLKHTATGDDTPIVLTLQTGETDIAANDVIGKVAFQAPDEGEGTDAILVAAAIQARSEGDFSSSANATSIDFMTGASEAAATKWSITSAGSFLNAGTNTIDMNGGELILDANANTSITADTDDQIDIHIAGADDFQFTANTFTAVSGSSIVQADGKMFLGETANTNQTIGLTINQGAADDHCLTFKSSDVSVQAAGMSIEADTYGSIKKYDGAGGTLLINGYGEGATGLAYYSWSATQPGTSPATSVQTCPFVNYALIYENSDYAFDANSLLWVLRKTLTGGSARSVMFVDEDGDIHLDGTSNNTVFDTEDDAMLCRSLDLMRGSKNVIRGEFDSWTTNHKSALEDAGVISKIDPDNPDHWEDGKLGDPMVNITQLQRLHNGAIWQQRAMFETMKQVAEEMLPGFGKKLNERLVEQKLPALPVSA